MSRFDINIEWLRPLPGEPREVAETFARLQINIEGRPVTRVSDLRSGGQRDAIYGPAYPLASWIVDNWWSLLYEVESDVRAGDYDDRHRLTRVAEGFAWPDLRIVPEGDGLHCRWSERTHEPSQVAFHDRGSAVLPRDTVEQSLRMFVTTVLTRLADRGVRETSLAEDWALTCATETDSSEREFCQAAGRLGLDPLGVDDHAAEQILTTSGLDKLLRSELLDASSIDSLAASNDWLSGAQDELSESTVTSEKLGSGGHWREARDQLRPRLLNGGPPWKMGLELATLVRAANGVPHDQSPRDFPWTWEPIFRHRPLNAPSSIVALASTGSDKPPSCCTATRRAPRATKFAAARAIYFYLTSGEARFRLISDARTADQKASRAFAAEFLAPREFLRRRIHHNNLTPDEISDLADELDVSERVIAYQIRNNRLGELPDEPD